jgi:viologen exporter family transport system permease protein
VAELLVSARRYRDIATLWARAALAYPVSFGLLVVGGALITGLDFIGILIMFANVDQLGGFRLREIALLYGATALGIGVADLLVGSVERIGFYVRTGRLDVMLTKPVPLLVQVCANEFSLRRISRILQGGAVFAWAAWVAVDWTPARVVVAVAMVVSGAVIFFSLFVGFACIQFWTSDASELANAFTYGGNTLTQYPLTVFPAELVKSLTFVLPVAFVNWYPCLFLLGREDPFGLPAWLQLCSPVAAAALLVVALAVWRAGVRHYSSTGS